jgi:alkaline phosphatase
MKVRNQIIALFCLAVFAGLGALYVRMWVVQKPRQIILFVSDSLATRPLTAARLYAGGADYRFEMEQNFPHVALLRNSSEDFAVPDSASAATALATGRRGNHRLVSSSKLGMVLETILERASKDKLLSKGRAVGLVTNSVLSAPSAAAFYAHSARAQDSEGIALQLFERDWMRVALGGGAGDFLPENLEDGEWKGRRKDQRNLVNEWREKGALVVRNKEELEQISTFERRRVVGLFSNEALPFANQLGSGSRQPSLADLTERAIDVLSASRSGYVLVVDASLYSKACEMNFGEKALREVIALDEAIKVAVRKAGDKALILAVGGHGTGGLTLSGHPLRQQKGPEFLGLDSAGYPYLSWASGPNGPQPASTAPRKEPASVLFSYGLETAEDMIGLGRGPGSERLSGFMENTVIFKIILDAL